MRKNKFSASESMQGYLCQCCHALLLLLRRNLGVIHPCHSHVPSFLGFPSGFSIHLLDALQFRADLGIEQAVLIGQRAFDLGKSEIGLIDQPILNVLVRFLHPFRCLLVVGDLLPKHVCQPVSAKFIRPPGRILHAVLPRFAVTTSGHRMTDLMDNEPVTLVRVGVPRHDLDYPAIPVTVAKHSSLRLRTEPPKIRSIPAGKVQSLDVEEIL